MNDDKMEEMMMYKNRIVTLLVALLMLLTGTVALAENTITVQGIDRKSVV